MPTFANNEALSSVRQKINTAIEDVEWGRGGFTTVADLLSNSTLTNDGTLEGQIFTAGGFRYQRAASTATDHHVTTAGGVKLYALPLWVGATGGIYAFDAWGPNADGVTDDSALLQAAIYATGRSELYLGSPSYRLNETIYAPEGKAIRGNGTPATRLIWNASTSKDGLVLGFRNFYANEAAFNAALSGLEDGWYYFGTTTKLVLGGAVSRTGARNTAQSANQTGYIVENIMLEGVDRTKVRDLFFAGVLFNLKLDNVRLRYAGGRGFRFYQCLHVSGRLLRSEDTVLESCLATDGENTTIELSNCYFRKTDAAAGIKSNCLGLTLTGCILEGIGDGTGTPVYYPGIWITGGNATIVGPYFEDVAGHNILCDAGVTTIVGGQNGAGVGALTDRYAAVMVRGSALVSLNGAGYAPGGGNKTDVRISKAATGAVIGSTFFEPRVLAEDPLTETDYTNADNIVANEAAVLAIAAPTTGQVALALDTFREYVYSGTAWAIVSNSDFLGYLTGRDVGATDGTSYRVYGRNTRLHVSTSASEIQYLLTQVFNANASANNIASMQSGAAIGANTQVTTTVTLTESIPSYGSGTVQNFNARFNVSNLAAGLDVRANILSATQVQIIVFNYTTASINLTADIRGRIVVEQFQSGVD
jgi:hypothetical protein